MVRLAPDVCPVDWIFVCLLFYWGGPELDSSFFCGSGVVGYFSCIRSLSPDIDERGQDRFGGGKINPNKLLESAGLVGDLGLFVDSILSGRSKIQARSKGLCPMRATIP